MSREQLEAKYAELTGINEANAQVLARIEAKDKAIRSGLSECDVRILAIKGITNSITTLNL